MPNRDSDVLQESTFYRALVCELEEYAVFGIDSNGILSSWNPGVGRILGFAQEDFVGRPFSCLFSEDDRLTGVPEARLRLCRESGRVQEREWQVRKDGTQAYVSGVITRVLDEHGHIAGFTKIVHDITPQKTAEDARKRLITKLGDLAYALDLTHTMIRGLDGTIHRWTRGAESLYGWTAAEAEGQNAHQLFRTESPQPLADIEEQLLQRGEWHGELTHTSKAGTRLHVASHWALRQAQEGSEPLVIEVNNDVTEIKRAQHEVERANRALSSFSYEVAHDLQSPLRSMGMCAQLLTATGEQSLSAEQAELIQTISENSERLRKMVQSLLQYASTEGKQGDRQVVSLARVLERALQNLSQAITESGIRVQYDSLPDVCVNESKLLQVLQNLVSNAIKYRRPGIDAFVKVSADVNEHGWTVHVQDNGLGIDESSLERVFTPLQRLHGPEISGTGLGLAICRRAVEGEGGRIWLESTPGQGSTFHFTICR